MVAMIFSSTAMAAISDLSQSDFDVLRDVVRKTIIPTVPRPWRGILCSRVVVLRYPVVVGTRLLLRLSCMLLNN